MIATSAHRRGLGIVLSLLGGIGLIASFVLTMEYLRLSADSAYVASCDVNSVVSCGSVMRSPSSALVGDIPNSLLGVAGFAALTALGVGLVAAASFSGWLWFLMQLGVTVAVIFVHFMMWDSLFILRLLCPYCMVVWAVTIPIFVAVSAQNLRAFGGINVAVTWRWVISLAWVGVVAAVVIAMNHQYLF